MKASAVLDEDDYDLDFFADSDDEGLSTSIKELRPRSIFGILIDIDILNIFCTISALLLAILLVQLALYRVQYAAISAAEMPKEPSPRFAIFIGPHKTASTTLQEWLFYHTDFLEQYGWVWPQCKRPKCWSSFAFGLLNCTSINKDRGCRKSSSPDKMNFYMQSFRDIVARGQNLVIANEAFDEALFKPDMAKGLLRASPVPNPEVYCMIRYPRWRHMRSYYGQLTKNPNTTTAKLSPDFESFVCQKFITYRNSTKVYGWTVLQLAIVYKNEGFNTMLMNYSAISHADFVSTVVRESLNIDIGPSKTMSLNVHPPSEVLPVKQTDMIEDVLRKMDCYRRDADLDFNTYKLDKKKFMRCNDELTLMSVNQYLLRYCSHFEWVRDYLI